MSHYIIMGLFIASYVLIPIERFYRKKGCTICIHKIKIRIVYYFWWIIGSTISYTTFLMSKSFENKEAQRIFFKGWNQQYLFIFSVVICIGTVIHLIKGILNAEKEVPESEKK